MLCHCASLLLCNSRHEGDNATNATIERAASCDGAIATARECMTQGCKVRRASRNTCAYISTQEEERP